MKDKIWIFIIEQDLSEEMLSQLLNDCRHFVSQWKSHEMPTRASVELYKNRLLIFRNDELFNPIGGCATDNLFRFIQDIEKKYQTNLLNRNLVVFEKENKLMAEKLSNIPALIENGEITENTIVYNTAIVNSDDWNEFQKPAKESWLAVKFEMHKA